MPSSQDRVHAVASGLAPLLPDTTLGRATYAIFALACLLAIWKGDAWKRLTGWVLLAAVVVTPLIQDRLNWMDPALRLFWEDLALLVILLGLAMHVGSAWTIVCAAFQLNCTLTHPAAHFLPFVGPFVYTTILTAFSYGVYLTLGVAVIAEIRGARGWTEWRPIPRRRFGPNAAVSTGTPQSQAAPSSSAFQPADRSR